MKKFGLPLVILVLALFVGTSFAQGTQAPTQNLTASDKTNENIHKLDLLIKLVPLALKKEQYPDLLLGIERAFALKKAEQEKEDKELAAMDADVSEGVTNAVEKGIYPPRELQNSVAAKLDRMTSDQINVGIRMVKVIYDTIDAKLNAGQRKAMAGSFSEKYIDPKIPASAMTDDVKIRFFIRNIFMDNACYGLLLEMSKHAS